MKRGLPSYCGGFREGALKYMHWSEDSGNQKKKSLTGLVKQISGKEGRIEM